MKKLLLLVLLFVTPVMAQQYARPDSDDAGGWDLCSLAGELCLGDNDDGTGCEEDDGSTVTLGLSAVTDPGVDTGHILTARCLYQSGNGVASVRLTLYDPTNSDVASTGSMAVTTDVLANYTYELSEAEAAEITAASYAGAWTVVADASSTGTRDTYCTEFWLEVPAAAGAERRVVLVH